MRAYLQPFLWILVAFLLSSATTGSAFSAPPGKARPDKLVVAISNSGGRVWGRLSVGGKPCSRATCKFTEGKYRSVTIRQKPVNGHKHPFLKWMIDGATVRASVLKVRMTRSTVYVRAIYKM